VLARDLYAAHPEMLEDQAILSVFAHAVRQTGDWLTVAADLKPGAWTASVPAVEEKSSATGIRLKIGGKLDLAPAVARSFAGFNAQMRVNETGRPFAVGFLLDGGARKILLRETGEVALLDLHEGRERTLGAVVLDARPGPNRWFDLAWAQEGDLVVVYFDARPLFARRVAAPPAAALALWADVAANFRGLTRRQ
jgi:hypothetical protein